MTRPVPGMSLAARCGFDDLSRQSLVYLCALGVGVEALVAWRFGLTPALPAYLYLGAIGTVLAIVDATTRRLPNALVVPSYPVGLVLLGIATAAHGHWWPLIRACVEACSLGGLFLLVALAFPGQLGAGDVKLIGLLGLFSSWLNPLAGFVGLFVAFGLASVSVGLRHLTPRTPSPSDTLPLGPYLLLASLVALVLFA